VDEVQELEVDSGLPLGVEAGTAYATTDVDLGSERFTVFCYSDGVIEAMDSGGRQFGQDRLLGLLLERRDLAPQALVRQVRKSVAGFVGGAPQSDDITLLAGSFA
jgi:sigma-B regulation protein RsbU (phosphoserine phosphatase)